jgi:hypothetical protein
MKTEFELSKNKALNKTDVSSSLSISEIKKRLDNCIDLYTDLFCQKQEVYAAGWIGEIKGGINCFADAYLSFEDIRTDLELDAQKGMVFEWYWDNVENEGKAINYYSYVLGLRISDIKEEKCDNPFCDKGNMFKKPDDEHLGCECFPNRV